MAPTSGPGWVKNAVKQSTWRIWTGPLRTRDGTWTGPGWDLGEGLDGTPKNSNRRLGLSDQNGCDGSGFRFRFGSCDTLSNVLCYVENQPAPLLSAGRSGPKFPASCFDSPTPGNSSRTSDERDFQHGRVRACRPGRKWVSGLRPKIEKQLPRTVNS